MVWETTKSIIGKDITEKLYEKGMIETWYRDKPEGWRLVSKLWSPFYINLRTIGNYPSLLREIGSTMGRMIKAECPEVNKIVGIAQAGIPIATAITVQEDIPSCSTRKLEGIKTIEQFETKIGEYGEHKLVEGELEDGDRIALVDDLVTRFDSKMVALGQVNYEAKKRNVSISCKDVAVLLDREQGAEQRATELEMHLHSIIPFKSKGLDWLRDKWSAKEHEVISDYLKDTAKYQDEKLQKELMNLALKV